MPELKLEPGWLTRDLARATQQASEWQSAKTAPKDDHDARGTPSGNKANSSRERDE